MQGKGIVRFFLVVMTIVTIVQYLYILPTRKVERKADEYARLSTQNLPEESQKEAFKVKRTEFLDSMSSVDVVKIPMLKSYTYQELKSQQLALGLDLKGGMSVVLQVDLREFITALSNKSNSPPFLKALEGASQAQKNAQSDYVSLFYDAWNKEAKEGDNLASIFIRNEALRDQINSNTSDGEVIRLIRSKADETVDLTFKLLKERIDKLGVTQPNVSLDASRDLIVVELPGIDNPERARSFLQAAAKLEFWKVYRISDPGIQQAFVEANSKLAKTMGTTGTTERQIDKIDTLYNVVDSLGRIDSTQFEVDTLYTGDALTDQGPLFDVFSLNATGSQGLAIMGLAKKNQRRYIDTLLSKPEIRSIFPRDMVFCWSKDPAKNYETGESTDDYELYALRMGKDGNPALTGDHVVDASANPDPQTNEVAVSLKMDNTGAKLWGAITTEAAQDQNREVAIVLDNEVVSCPRVINPILTGDSQISGTFTIQEGKDLANILQIGKLPAETKIIQESLVGPSLGKDNIQSSTLALVIGFAIVLLFMVAYYGGGGIVSILALLLNIFFILGALASYGTVLTLPGIAGIVLTIGMAVDANVIIFERIREELRDGKTLLAAIGDGFKHSYSAIIDANVTTLLTAAVLAYFGLGPIKGFAVVLIIGVLCSLFTAVLVGRLIIEWWTGKGRSLTFETSFSKNAFANLNVNWMAKRKMAYMVSGAVILAGLISIAVRGFDLGVDFKGGYSYNVTFDASKTVTAQELRDALTPTFDNKAPVVKAVDSENTFNVVTNYLVDDTEDDAADRVMAQLYQGVNSLMGGNIKLDQFKAPDGDGTHVTSSSKVGPTIADDIQKSAFYAGIFALLLIFLYIFIRFSKWQYSAGAVAALFHDSLIVLGIFSLLYGVLPFSMEIDQAFIAAILTVIGYSINDTVVVFDRIREFIGLYSKKTKEEAINLAINSTLSRTLITSLTTLFVIAVLLLFGGSSIKGFAFALFVGIIVGTYSSIFIATPVMADLSGDLNAKPAKVEKKGFSRTAETAK
ncbi:MAG TPA: protein translocase subunit SecDF [Saprospiraceae bacterium]|nr:protein translocase subunit SecDF [Saprospiraceae bacterium]HMQ84516.1 protein translocase subunit SecDF [Saprospiraceae bacterium]